MIRETVMCDAISKSFGKTAVVDQVSFRLEAGQIMALLGPSGCGKTTILRLIAGFEQLDGGQIVVAGQVVADERMHLPPEKRRVGMVFQDYAIFPHLSVRQNVAFGLGRGPQADARSLELLDMVGLAGQADQMPHELSGGQQQRVALARALAPEPAVLLLDEPFSNLDTALRLRVRGEVRDLLRQSGATAIFVTHDQEEALFLGDEVAVINEGKLEQVGTPETIYHQPQTRFVAQFMGQTDFVCGRATSGGVATPMGMLPQVLPLPDQTRVEVAVRPDDVIIQRGDEANARIIARQFMGMSYLYRLALAEGDQVHSWQPHTVSLPVGTLVNARLTHEHPLSCFYEGRAIH